MPAPALITNWIRQAYPKPTVDPAWLDACLAWMSEELHLNDINSQADEIISNVDSQLLNSDLHDSMVAGTGFPRDIGSAENTRLRGNILVQIQGMTEIGHSAFSLQNVQQTRIDRADLAGLAGDGDEAAEDEGPVPKYPRSMLRFDLSDGSQTLRAIEFRPLPAFELGTTPLGFKMILKDAPIRRGIAFLDPSNIVLKGCMTEELDVNRAADFARGLRMRLGLIPRAPLREMTREDLPPPRPPRAPGREELEPPSRRRVPTSSASTLASSSRTVVSPYFSNTSAPSATLVSSEDLADVHLSPVRRASLLHKRPAGDVTAVEESFDFSDDIQVDDAFLQELDAVEQAALNTIHQRGHDSDTGPSVIEASGAAVVSQQSEVIVIDSDSDDKENLAPVVQRRVRRRLATPSGDDSDVIVIE
ncbi:hypothetical protein K439DRAFT_1370627 [Ramaria rubella]|nr:hypothetical protein K439DRAFT_1370627 [Ramaria rubella]